MNYFKNQTAVVFRVAVSKRTIKVVPIWELRVDDAIKICSDARSILPPNKSGIRVPTFLTFSLSSHVPLYTPYAEADEYFNSLAVLLNISIINSCYTV